MFSVGICATHHCPNGAAFGLYKSALTNRCTWCIVSVALDVSKIDFHASEYQSIDPARSVFSLYPRLAAIEVSSSDVSRHCDTGVTLDS